MAEPAEDKAAEIERLRTVAASCRACRLWEKPNAGEIDACRRWLFAEIETLQTRIIVALGATAAQGLDGRPVAIGANRGKVMEGAERLRVFVTVHPSSLLSLPDEAARRAAYDLFVANVRLIGGPTARSSREPSTVGYRDA
jgi:uracil-DNA glycosylase family 4